MLDHVQIDCLTSTTDDLDWSNLNDRERRLIRLFRSMNDGDKQKIRRVTEVIVMSYGGDDRL
ncbi:hypothetical protein DYL59_24395 [Pseudomonas kairouanensis]|uniref:Uncharacterized protein n=1 Tax=Pseudomonas kairouanensis TaxID=2293832 RepID=A0A4Z0AIE4_9PSED|nr:hypothetical protein [Pseudomonas kairouanensis]TFY85778.1 hypothetical protein DYL59_24395 [Pseudomonas kairouanensis]